MFGHVRPSGPLTSSSESGVLDYLRVWEEQKREVTYVPCRKDAMHPCGRTPEVSDQGYSEGQGVRTRAFVSKGDGHKLSDGKFFG